MGLVKSYDSPLRFCHACRHCSTSKWDDKCQGKNGERTHADAVLWLCSDKASCITGQSISVDGGYVMR
jgi:NAD(P)-dependent dehydrogenase (short-subunit alcohol dehydrogenase family)